MKDQILPDSVCFTELVCRAQRGDTTAFDALVCRFQDHAVAYARALLHFDRAAAEDAAQEAFVQAWCELPALQHPQAFPAWLRRIVFKYCDRIRRHSRLTLVPLDTAFHVAGGIEPARTLEAGQDAALVRAALESLPPRERECALLYYRDDRDLAQIASFLDIPRTTVKNRLHAARLRLRKELWEMAEQILEQEKPSRSNVFAGSVLSRVLDEFRRQMRADPHTADRRLLTQGREALDEALAKPGPLAWETVRSGFDLLSRDHDNKANAALLTRYLAQPLDDSHTTWAYFFLANCLAGCGEAAGAILASDAFERWLPGRNPRLSNDWPYDPVPAGAEAATYEGEQEAWLRFLGKSGEFALAWRAVWRDADYLAKVDAALERAKAFPPRDFGLRFSCMRMATLVCETGGNFDRDQGYIAQMYALAAEPESETDRAYWRIKAIVHDIRMSIAAGEDERAREKCEAAADVLTQFKNESWVRGERHDLACNLERLGQYERALRLFDANRDSGGHVNDWGDFLHAALTWHVTHDRSKTLTLLRHAAATGNRARLEEIRVRPEFADVREDPEFLAAVQKPG